ncbi:hypothetical protein N9L68_03395 [bacterium]|nr:hypothetical protein [bacterium]
MDGGADKLNGLTLRQMADSRKVDVAQTNSGERVMSMYEESGITAVYDPERGGEFAVEKTPGIDGGNPSIEGVLGRHLNGLKWQCAHNEDVMP